MKYIYILLFVAVLVGAGVFVYMKSQPSGQADIPAPTPAAVEQPAPYAVAAPSPVVSPASHVVTFTDSGYSPKTITIKKGETITWKNESSERMWTATNPHPAHTGYPESGGCRASDFDECRGDAPGAQWSFTFNVAGTWGYHNHLDMSVGGGTVIVK